MIIDRHHKFMWSFTKVLLASLRRPVIIYLVSLSISFVPILSAAFYAVEHDSNPQIRTFFDSLYFTVTVMTGVGLGDIYPITVAGRLISMVMMLLGTGIFISFTATLSASILDIELRLFKN